MRKKLESLPITELREIAKSKGIKSVTTMRKASLVEKIIEVTGDDSVSDDSSSNDEPQIPGFTMTTVSNQNQAPSQSVSLNASQSTSLNTSSRTQPYSSSAYNTSTYEPKQRNYTPTYERTRNFDRNSQTNDRVPQRTYENRTYERQTPSPITGPDDAGFDPSLDSGASANGILEVMQDGFGFIRCANYMPGENDVYVSPMQIRKFNLKTGDIVEGRIKVKTATEKFAALLYITSVNGYTIGDVLKRPNFENLTPIFPNERLRLETVSHNTAMRIVDIVSPIGKGQRGMIVSPPKAGKTTLLKEVARAIQTNNPEIHMIILLIDERPEEVTDIKEAIEGDNVEVIYSTFDQPADHHKRVAEMVIERGRRLVEHGQDVVILLDSITRLARAYNLVVSPSGRTLSGGLDPAALNPPKKFFGAARNMREGGSLTILATALVDTGSRMDDVVFEEFKGTGNMELVLDRSLSEKRVFPAIDILKSGTRRDDLLLSPEEMAAADIIKKISASAKPEDAVENVLNLFANTKDNAEFCNTIIKQKI